MTNLIRLNDKGIRVYTSRAGSTHGPTVRWAERLGRLVKHNRDRSLAYVIWDGNRSPDRVSVELIEPCGVAGCLPDSHSGERGRTLLPQTE